MSNLKEIFKKVFKSKVLHYVFSRYATYFIQFINSIFIAVYLGPYYLGVWGFITLIIQYLNQINFGIAHSVNVIIAVHKDKHWYVQKVIGTSITMLIMLSILVAIFFAANELFQLQIGDKYNFSQYAPVVLLIGIFGYFNQLMSNIFRVYGQIIEIAFNQSSVPILILLTIILYNNSENLLWVLVLANLFAFLTSFMLYLLRCPVKFKPIFVGRLMKTIQIKGWYLFVYNTSFYLIIISTRSFISGYYSVEEFGYFTFAFSLANAVLLLLESLSFLIYPKLINRLFSATEKQAVTLLEMVRDAYISTSHLLIHFAIFLFPFFLLLFPQYNNSAVTFKMCALTVVLYTNSFGYSSLLISKGFEKKLGFLSLSIFIINIVLVFVLIEFFNVSFSFVISATMASYFLYVFTIGYFGRKMLELKTNFLGLLKDIFPLRLFIPFFLSLYLIIIFSNNLYFILPLIVFIIMNFGIFKKIKKIINYAILNPEFSNI